MQQYKEEINHLDMKDNIINCSHASQALNLFNMSVDEVLNTHAPIVTKYFKLDKKAWCSSECHKVKQK